MNKDREVHFNDVVAMVSRTRDQYVLDRYLKQDKNKPEKYQKKNILKELQKSIKKSDFSTDTKYKKELKKALELYLDIEKQDFTRIVKAGLFTQDNLAKYYFMKGEKAPTELDSEFEKILYNAKPSKKTETIRMCADADCMDQCQKNDVLCEYHRANVGTMKNKKAKLNTDNEIEMNAFFEALEKKEGKLTKKEKEDELVELGFIFGDLSFNTPRKDVIKEMEKKYKRYKKDLEKTKEKEEKIFDREVPLWKRELNAKNYKNEKYISADAKNNESYFRDRDLKWKAKADKLTDQITSINLNKRRPSKNLDKLRIRLRQLKKEEEDLKNKKKIKLIEAPPKYSRRKRKASVSSSSSRSRNPSIPSPKSSRSSRSRRSSRSS
jgi:hypothetical protein